MIYLKTFELLDEDKEHRLFNIEKRKIFNSYYPIGIFSQKEFDYFRAKKLPLISLGDLILKAETAVIVTLGDIVYEYQG